MTMTYDFYDLKINISYMCLRKHSNQIKSNQIKCNFQQHFILELLATLCLSLM